MFDFRLVREPEVKEYALRAPRVEATMNECLKGSLVRLTHGLGGARRERPMLRRWPGGRLHQRDLTDGEAQRHVWLTPRLLAFWKSVWTSFSIAIY
jgi:hypothetical protein